MHRAKDPFFVQVCAGLLTFALVFLLFNNCCLRAQSRAFSARGISVSFPMRSHKAPESASKANGYSGRWDGTMATPAMGAWEVAWLTSEWWVCRLPAMLPSWVGREGVLGRGWGGTGAGSPTTLAASSWPPIRPCALTCSPSLLHRLNR